METDAFVLVTVRNNITPVVTVVWPEDPLQLTIDDEIQNVASLDVPPSRNPAVGLNLVLPAVLPVIVTLWHPVPAMFIWMKPETVIESKEKAELNEPFANPTVTDVVPDNKVDWPVSALETIVDSATHFVFSVSL
jgi:hypothetical protein